MTPAPHPRAEGSTDADYYRGNITSEGLRNLPITDVSK
jgi:hypothetical protein